MFLVAIELFSLLVKGWPTSFLWFLFHFVFTALLGGGGGGALTMLVSTGGREWPTDTWSPVSGRVAFHVFLFLHLNKLRVWNLMAPVLCALTAQLGLKGVLKKKKSLMCWTLFSWDLPSDWLLLPEQKSSFPKWKGWGRCSGLTLLLADWAAGGESCTG